MRVWSWGARHAGDLFDVLCEQRAKDVTTIGTTWIGMEKRRLL